MTAAIRLTPAQRRGLELLATPGAEAHTTRGVRWEVVIDDVVVGSIHAESLLALRDHDLVVWGNGGEHPLDFRQRISKNGRAYLALTLREARP